MKITFRVKACRLVAGAALFSGLGFIAPVLAQELPRERGYFIDLNDRSVTALESLGGGQTAVEALNDSDRWSGPPAHWLVPPMHLSRVRTART